MFRDTFFHLQATTAVGRASHHHVPINLFPLFATLAGEGFPPEAMDEALVGADKLVVGLINSMAKIECLAPDILPPLLKLLERVTTAVARGESRTLTALAAAVSWDKVMPNVSWDDMSLCLVVHVTHQHDRNQRDRLKWCLLHASFSDLALKQALQASLMSTTECPPSVLFAGLIASDEYSERELVRMINAWNLHDTDDGCAWNLAHTNGVGDSSACGV